MKAMMRAGKKLWAVMRTGRRIMWTAGMTMLVCVASVNGLAQIGDEDGPPIAMGTGRMVRGTVTVAATGTAKDRLTLKTEEGEVYQVAVTSNTQVRKGREPMKFADVHAGDGVGAMGEVDRATKTVHALFVGVMDAEQVRKVREGLGKTWIAGTVTAIDEVRLTVLRADKVSQVIAVDEDTSFKRGGREMQMMFGDGGVSGGGEAGGGGAAAGKDGGARRAKAGDGESLTLLDVKVGNTVAGQGELKHGVFVPTQLAVSDAPAHGRGRRQGENAREPK